MAGFAWPDAGNSPLKTTCPSCATIFRVTPEQLASRAGKVRCGKCQTVFNATEHLVDSKLAPSSDSPLDVSPAVTEPPVVESQPPFPEETPAAFFALREPENEPAAPSRPLNDTEAQDLALSSGLIVARGTTEIPGYSKWSEGAIDSHLPSHAGKPSHWPFMLVALLLSLVLIGQMAFHFRSEIAVAAPSVRPPLETLSDWLGSTIPLPQHAELISIESSDLQVDPKRTHLLALQATLRNRAPHEQAYPALQLSLTDTQDTVIARRVFLPGEYLSPQNLTPLIFAANGEVSVRLWIEANEITAAGYRLYAFYP